MRFYCPRGRAARELLRVQSPQGGGRGTPPREWKGVLEPQGIGNARQETAEDESRENMMPSSLRGLRPPLGQVLTWGGVWYKDKNPREVEKGAESRGGLAHFLFGTLPQDAL